MTPTFGQIIKEALLVRRENITWLARESGVKYNTLLDYLKRDDPKLTPFDLYAILRAMGMCLTDLFECSVSEAFKFEFSSKLHRDTKAELIAKARACLDEIEEREKNDQPQTRRAPLG